MPDRSRLKHAIEFRTYKVLHHCAHITRASRFLLPTSRLIQKIAHKTPQAMSRVKPNLERLAGKKVFHTINPVFLNHCDRRRAMLRIFCSLVVDAIQKFHVCAHVFDASATRAASLLSEHLVDIVTFQDGLDGRFAQAEDLSSARRHELIRIKGQSQFPCMVCNNERNAKGSRTFAFEIVFRGEFVQHFFEISWHELKRPRLQAEPQASAQVSFLQYA